MVYVTAIFGLSEYVQARDQYDRSSGNSYTWESLFRNASFIMNFSYIYRNISDDEMSVLQIPTFLAPDVIQYPKSGLNLNYGELAVNPQIDNNFEIFLILFLQKMNLK